MFSEDALLLIDYKTGGKIRINPSKRGTFTAAAKKHGKSVQAFASQVLAHKENYSPAMVKKANFARNAAKWHADGGVLKKYGAEAVRKALSFMQQVGQQASENARDVRTATASSTVKDMVNAGREEDAYNFAKRYTKLGLLGSALGAGAGMTTSQAAHALKVLANPAAANTTKGAAVSTLLDSYGLVSGANELGKDATKAVRGEYTLQDIPKTLIDATVLMPGASQFTSAKNIDLLEDAAETMRFIPFVSSKKTTMNRLAHPVESYRLANIAKRVNGVLPDDVYFETRHDLSRTKLHNRANGQRWHNPLNQRALANTLGVTHDAPNATSNDWTNINIWGLSDPVHNTDFARAHEVGHIMKAAAERRGYNISSMPHPDYQSVFGTPFSKTANPTMYVNENISDIFGNAVTNDMPLESYGIVAGRSPYVRNETLRFSKK